MSEFISFTGRTAVVTGGTRGLGLAITRALIKHGAKVHVFDVTPGEPGDAYQFHKVDISDSASVNAAVAQLPDKVSLLVNNAGITRDKSIGKMTDEDWQSVLSVNLTGAFYVVRALAPAMREAGYGRIVNITSINGMRGKFGQANYSASKAGVVGLTRTLALELARYSIRVNAIAPGFIDTEMTRAVPEDVRERAIKGIPLRRVGQPEDIANAALFLASEESSYITGQVLMVCGGRSLGGSLA